MNFRTSIKTEGSDFRINHSTPVTFIGSCFAAEIAGKMDEGRMTNLVNPFGTVYNPVSISNTLSIIIENRIFKNEDLYLYNENYVSLYHYTDFSSVDPAELLGRINATTKSSNEFLSKAEFLFLTFGTARVYRLRESGMIVSNCHKIPAKLFSQELLDLDEITKHWWKLLDELRNFNKNLKVIFTISPVRHMKDGAHENQVSKSVLFLAVEKLLAHPISGGYFPAYEILMDDLRDYRFYADDMLHPSTAAVEYIWQAFSSSYLSSEALSLWKEVRKVTNAVNHRFMTNSVSARKDFANDMLSLITTIELKAPWINFTSERSHFKKIVAQL